MKTKSTLRNLCIVMMLTLLPSFAISQQVDVTFKVDMSGIDMTNATGVYIIGEVVENWTHVEMTLESGNIYAVTLSLPAGDVLYYYYTIATDWAPASREDIPAGPCANSMSRPDVRPDITWDTDRLIEVPAAPITLNHIYGGCDTPTAIGDKVNLVEAKAIAVNGGIEVSVNEISEVSIISINGVVISQELVVGKTIVPCSNGIYIVQVGNVATKVVVK
ncbi:hypothetical protein E9993_20115 [Labilibacter sediminis]|nr:hypothetical protein E9993_20115 [Labilibacter sediminis]